MSDLAKDYCLSLTFGLVDFCFSAGIGSFPPVPTAFSRQESRNLKNDTINCRISFDATLKMYYKLPDVTFHLIFPSLSVLSSSVRAPPRTPLRAR